MRQTIIDRYLITPETSQDFVFRWLKPPVLPDKNLIVIVIATDADAVMGVLQSSYHEARAVAHAHAVRKFWHDRIHPKDGSKPMSDSNGNKDLGSLRKLYRRYFVHIGEEKRENPFLNMRFKDKIITKVRSFKDDWVRSRILAPDVLNGLNRQGALYLTTNTTPSYFKKHAQKIWTSSQYRMGFSDSINLRLSRPFGENNSQCS